jgi:hypothetical protein
MAWTEPLHSRSQVDKAGRAFVDPKSSRDERELALAVINNWRSAHGFPLNTMQMGLRHKAIAHDGDALVAQRIKRLASIRAKLERYPDMGLSRMQDIGGCRAVVNTVSDVLAVRQEYERSRSKHKLLRCDDYMFDRPKPSGYRGLHLIYRYYSDRKTTFNGLRVEVQVRSRLQHRSFQEPPRIVAFERKKSKGSQGHSMLFGDSAPSGTRLHTRNKVELAAQRGSSCSS